MLKVIIDRLIPQLDQLVLRELIPMWFFGTLLFTVLVMSAQFLSSITDLIAAGADASQVIVVSLDLLPGFISTGLPMGTLLGALLAMGRLSGDSEIVAMRAAGASIERIMRPVFLFGLSVAILTFCIGEFIVPRTSYDAVARTTTLEKRILASKRQPLSQPLLDNGNKIVGFLNAVDLDMTRQEMVGVTIIRVDEQGKPLTIMKADRLRYISTNNWAVVGLASLLDLKSLSQVDFQDAWPAGSEKVTEPPQNLIARTLSALDVYTMGQLKEHFESLKREKDYDVKDERNQEFWYWNKLAFPLSALVFGMLGAPLGIRNHRAGIGVGFALAIAIIFAYLMVANTLNVFNEREWIPAYMASFTPVIIGLAAAAYMTHRRNTR